jgi:thiamine biosynthesis lipoprotein
MKTAALRAITLAACLGAFGILHAQELQLVQRSIYVMGTQALVAAYAPDRHAGVAALESAIRELETAEAQLSTWRSDSAISELNRAEINAPWQAGEALCRLFEDLYTWHEATSGAFDPAIGALASAWQIHGTGRVPLASELEAARRRTGLTLIDFDRQTCSLRRTTDVILDVGAFGKGEALDRIARALAGRSWLADLGGQVSVGGMPPDGKPWIVDIAHPADRSRPVMQVQMQTGSLSTSGGSERDTFVGEVRVGHILDVRTGAPARFNGSVVVWHERGVVADILSTALFVMGPEEGLRWAERRGIAAAYLMPTNDGVARAATTRFGDLRPVNARE